MRCWGIKLRTSYTPGDPLHPVSYTASLSGILALLCACNFQDEKRTGNGRWSLGPKQHKIPRKTAVSAHHTILSETKVMGTRPWGLINLRTEYSSCSEIKIQRHRAEGTKDHLRAYLTLERPEAVGNTPAFTHRASPRCQILAMSYMHIFMTDAPYRVYNHHLQMGRSSSLKVASTCLTWQSWFDLAFKINSGSQIRQCVHT